MGKCRQRNCVVRSYATKSYHGRHHYRILLQALLLKSETLPVMRDFVDETIKENASVVDSSLTECKHDRENCDGTESSSGKDNEECDVDTEGEQVHAFCEVENSRLMEKDKRQDTRYFIIKSLNHHNIQLSVEKGIWATQVMNEPILEEAFHNADRVILIFSVNMSGFFQGYAQMMSSVGWRRDNVWGKSSGGNNPWGRTFKVKWLRLYDLPFQKTLHLKNPLNDYKPVKISRDCQELSEDVGEALCWLFDEEVDIKGKLKRNSPVHLQNEDCLLPIPSSHLRWAGPVMPPPSLLYHHVAKHEEPNCQVHGSASNRRRDRDAFFQPNVRDTPREGNLAVSLSEEDILNMTYEEYLQAVRSSSVSSPHLAAVEQTLTMQGSQSSREEDDDPYFQYLASWHRSKKLRSNARSLQ